MIGWRDADTLLVETRQDQWYNTGPLRIDTVDLLTGIERMAYLMPSYSPHGDRQVVGSAEHLSDRLDAIRF